MSNESSGAQDVTCVCAGIGVLGLIFIGISIGIASTLVVQSLIVKIRIWTPRGESEMHQRNSVSRAVPASLCSSCMIKAKSIKKLNRESCLNEDDAVLKVQLVCSNHEQIAVMER
jgi:hypothetical protein